MKDYFFVFPYHIRNSSKNLPFAQASNCLRTFFLQILGHIFTPEPKVQSQNSDDDEAELNAHFGITKHSGLNRGNSASNSPMRRPVSPIFPSEKGQCPMCHDMITLSRLPTHAALCEGTPMYIPE